MPGASASRPCTPRIRGAPATTPGGALGSTFHGLAPGNLALRMVLDLGAVPCFITTACRSAPLIGRRGGGRTATAMRGSRRWVRARKGRPRLGPPRRLLESAPLPLNLKTRSPPLIATGIVGSGRARVMPRSAGASPCLGAARPCKATTLPDTTIPPTRAALCRGSGQT